MPISANTCNHARVALIILVYIYIYNKKRSVYSTDIVLVVAMHVTNVCLTVPLGQGVGVRRAFVEGKGRSVRDASNTSTAQRVGGHLPLLELHY